MFYSTASPQQPPAFHEGSRNSYSARANIVTNPFFGPSVSSFVI